MEGLLQYRRLKASTTQQRSSPPASIALDSDDPDKNESGQKYVEFEPHDINDPKQWATSWKIFYTSIIWLLVFVTGWSSAADSTAHQVTADTWGVTEVVESLATSMYLWGVAFGALVAGPCSETIGRLTTYLGTFVPFLIFTMASALAPTFGGQIVFRGFAGLFASASMSVYGGSLADLYEPETRALIWPFFALSPLLGPVLAPVANGWLTQELGFRWDDWFTLIMASTFFTAAFLFLPETFEPIILTFKARTLRRSTDNTTYKSEYEDSTELSERLSANLSRIVSFTYREPTTVLFGLYLTFLYLLIYGFLEGFDFVFTDVYGFNVGRRYSAFGAVAIGIIFALPYVIVVNHFVQRRQVRPPNGEPFAPPPESRLVPSVFASPLLVLAIFWLGWTDRSDISYWSDLGACCLFGFSLMALFTTTYHYLLDAYGTKASSALAAITFLRYLASGGMVIVTEPLYKALTVKYTLTLLGGIAALLMPIPWVFWRYGRTIRAKSKWALRDEGESSEAE